MMFRRITILIVAASMILLTGQVLAANAVSVSRIDGYDSTTGGLMTNTPIRYYVHFEVGAETVRIMTNPFQVYSPDGAIWQPLVFRELVMFSSFFDCLFYCGIVGYGILDGMDADTFISHGAASALDPGLPPGFDSDYFLIETSLSDEQVGKTLCLDSLSFHTWSWGWAVTGEVGGVIPEWDGPHCYEIVDCCVGIRGDVNGDGVGPNIVDLVRLVDYLFRGATAPDCKLESDVNGDGLPYNLLDLIFVIDWMHRGGPAAPACPN